LIGVWYTSALWLYRNAPAASPATGVRAVPANANADAAAGRSVFASAGCGTCHTLRAAGTNGLIGPNLDSLRPTYAQVRTKVRRGGGGMPSFAGRLSAAQIRDVAAFVATGAGR
jgi:mono/diheme cytochrome c family protein